VGAVFALRRAFTAGVRSAGLSLSLAESVADGDAPPVTEADLAGLPAAARRYLRFMGVVGRPPDRSFRAHLTGRFRLRPGQRWMPMQAWQYNSAPDLARLFLLRVRFARVLPMVGWDTYLRGHGRMHGRLLGLLTVADGTGEEFDAGELTTYLNDAILLAPSMLLGPHTSWTPTGSPDAFDVALSAAGRCVRARVLLDGDGAPRDFSTEDRWAALPAGLVRTRWTTPVTGWQAVDGRRLPTAGAAVWHLPDSEFRYAEIDFRPRALTFNVAPGT
jgi:hypothetical protein